MTFTIVARERYTGLLGIAQSTSPLTVGGRCAFFRANVGAVCTQAFTDPGLGPLGIELLALGIPPKKSSRSSSTPMNTPLGYRSASSIAMAARPSSRARSARSSLTPSWVIATS